MNKKDIIDRLDPNKRKCIYCRRYRDMSDMAHSTGGTLSFCFKDMMECRRIEAGITPANYENESTKTN